MSGRISIERQVLGRPTGYAGGGNEQQWKAAVRHAFAGVTHAGRARIQGEADFVLAVQQRGRRGPDLDNLIKTALDVLEGVLGARSATGARVKPDDVPLNRIVPSKRHVRDGEQPGVRISVSRAAESSRLDLCGGA